MKQFLQLIVFLFFFGIVTAQQTDYVDFKSIDANLNLSSQLKSVNGMYSVEFEILKDVDSIFLDAKNIQLKSEVWENTGIEYTSERPFGERVVKSIVKDDKIWFYDDFKGGLIIKLSFVYECIPKKALYFVDDQIWTQGQGKYTSNWLPSIDDVNDKIEFDLSINHDNGYEVLSNGKLIKKKIGKEYTKWTYDMQKPMSSYLVALAIGKYDKKTETSKSGIPLVYYYYPEDSLKVEPTYRYSKQMFDFLEAEIGFPYPWQNYKQVPVKDFLYSGMENTSLTVFSDGFMVDSIGFNDKNYITVNAHELAHQWFGDLVTATSGEHHWLQEGFATYYALLAERDIFGDDHYYWQLFENAQELITQEEAGQSTSLLNPKSSSTTFYKKGAWSLHALREQVGDSAFKGATKKYLNNHQFGNVNTSDFISEVEKSSQQDLSVFVNDWLTEVTLPEDAIVKSLKKSAFMREYLAINCEEYSQKCKDYLVSNISDKGKIKVVSQISEHLEAEAFINNIEVRQAIAQYVSTIPKELKLEYESLLSDKSFVTIEAALYNLWANFPEERIKYLQKTKDIKGFNDYNVRLLWLVLHLNTIEYQTDNKQVVLNELIGYSLPEHHFELRMNAFNYLKLIGGFESESIKSLILATTHHNWRFSKFAKDLLETLKTNNQYRELIKQLKNN
ncbi:M1 family metallopeptidase [Psychroserpens burtonensis]|uniref:Aminopeptidase N n=1 Tax=Psychroserpens burtonensis TaxID=49278 RepID=A0A5C7BC23_9FLAO|nr:M1 family metallopeptidase [Psychroserpens burtonensis]TXE19718.1 M1 family metallopeptidase [Psychroserpens burtonensis]